MKLTKTTINMARRRGVSIEVFEPEDDDRLGDGTQAVEFAGIDEYGDAYDEYDALYSLTDRGLFFIGSCNNNAEEWPRWIEDEKHLRALLDDIANEVVS